MSLVTNINMFDLDDPFIKLDPKQLKSTLKCFVYTILFQRPYKTNYLKLNHFYDSDLEITFVFFD